MRYAVAALVLRSLLGTFRPWLAFALTFGVTQLAGQEIVDVLVVPTFFVAAIAVVRGDWDARWRWLVPVLGAIAGGHLLVKFNTGVAIAGIAGTAVLVMWWSDRRRWVMLPAFGLAATATFLAGWVATGNPLGSIRDFASTSVEIASGYSEAMSIGLNADTEAADFRVAVIAALVTAALVVTGSRGMARPRRIGAMAIAAWVGYTSMKHGFVRHESHQHIFFLDALLMATAFRWPQRAEAPVALGLAVLFVALVPTYKVPLGEQLRPDRSVADLAADLTTLAVPGRPDEKIDDTRAQLRGVYGLDEVVELQLTGRTVHIHPWETSIAWAYPEIEWRPMPVLQAYSAYTDALDDENAEFLRGVGAPEYILRDTSTVDERNASWESPAVIIELLCRYREVDVVGDAAFRWQLLERGPSVCGAPERLGVVERTLGDEIRVPRASTRDGFVVARVSGITDGPRFELVTQAWKGPTMFVHVTPGDVRYRLVPGTLGNGLVVQVPDALWSKGFAPADLTSLRFGADGLGTRDRVRVEFVEVQLLD